MSKLKPLAEQVIVLTGATSGIGLATALIAAKRGAKLIVAARNESAVHALAKRINEDGGEALGVPTDVGDRAAVLALRDAAMARFGRIDTWVNDAAAATFGKLEEHSIEDHRQVFETGYWGTVYGSLAFVEVAKGQGGALINVGSILSERAVLLQGPYCAMKHAVRGFTDTLRTELERDGANISVTLIKPAAMNTPYPEHARNLMDTAPALPPPLYDPRLSARAILFCAENPRRELTVGGIGRAMTLGAKAFPRLTDFMLELGGKASQSATTPVDPDREDNLHAPREDGAIEDSRPQLVRRTSLWLEAQMNPVAATAALALGTVAVIAALTGGARQRA